MNMQGIDWAILAVFLTALTGVGIYSRRYMRGVADFLAAGRCADRFLLTVAEGATLGTIVVVAGFQATYAAGLAPRFWSPIFEPIGVILAMSGYLVYRFRQTRALTLAQFFEMRYSRRFRMFGGLLAFVSGTINYGIFPGVSARFFVYFCGFPETIALAGFQVQTYIVIMAILMALALFFTFVGGMITIMITDFFQGLFLKISMLVILVVVMWKFPWSLIGETLAMAPPGESLLNPFDTGKVKDFNFWYYLIALVCGTYATMAWQGHAGYNSAASSPHELKMGRVLGRWRSFVGGMVLVLLPLAAYVYMHHPQYADRAAVIQAKLAPFAGQTIQREMTVPLAMADFLPVGIFGLFCTMMVSMFITCDDIYLHSWGSIFIQDVVMPFRKKPLTPDQHVRLLKISILGVAVFAFLFSIWFTIPDYIYMYMAITSAIYLGGAGSAIIGGLYWKRGTTWGAWGGMITGCLLAAANIVVQQLWEFKKIPGVVTWLWTHVPFLQSQWDLQTVLAKLPERFWINGQVGYFIAVCGALLVYVILSLVEGKVFDLDNMLHRDEAKDDVVEGVKVRPSWGSRFLVKIGMTGTEFSKWDKRFYVATFFWFIGWSLIYIAILLYHLLGGELSNRFWVGFWGINVLYMPLVITVIFLVLYLIFGFRDMVRMFRRLETMTRDHRDDGRVTASHPVGEGRTPDAVKLTAALAQAKYSKPS